MKKPTEAAVRTARYHARALAVQGLYGWLVGGESPAAIGTRLLTQDQLTRVDVEYFRACLQGTADAAPGLRTELSGHLDRAVETLSPIEHAVLLLGAWELRERPDIPYRVVLNEAIEITKTFGGTDGFRFVNGVLDRLAARLRSAEVQAEAR